MKSKTIQIPVDELAFDSNVNARPLKPALVEDKKQSIIRNDQIKPINVLPPAKDGEFAGKYRVYDGQHMAQAMIELHGEYPDDTKYEAIVAIVNNLDDDAAFVRSIAANNDSAPFTELDEARIIKRLHDEKEMTYAQAAEKFGKDETWALGRVRLLKLPVSVQKDLEQGLFDFAGASAIGRVIVALETSGLSKEEQKEKLKEVIELAEKYTAEANEGLGAAADELEAAGKEEAGEAEPEETGGKKERRKARASKSKASATSVTRAAREKEIIKAPLKVREAEEILVSLRDSPGEDPEIRELAGSLVIWLRGSSYRNIISLSTKIAGTYLDYAERIAGEYADQLKEAGDTAGAKAVRSLGKFVDGQRDTLKADKKAALTPEEDEEESKPKRGGKKAKAAA